MKKPATFWAASPDARRLPACTISICHRAGVATLPSVKRYALSGNIGTFRGQTAFGGVFQYRVSENIVLNGGVGAGFGYGGVGGRGGATYSW